MNRDESTIPEVFTHGTTWVRADFHLHTKRDVEFSYAGDESQFVTTYVDKLKKENIRVGVVTNHNKFDKDEFKALAKAARKEEILLLPGVELSIKDGSKGVHTLIVFSDNWYSNQAQTNHIEAFLSGAFGGQDNVENENSQCNYNVETTIQKLNEFERDYFLIFAHVEYDNGLWGALGGQRLQTLANSDEFRERCLGFQKVRTRDERDKIKQHLGNWYPAEVEGCDCKSIDEVGKGQQCFIKLGAFTYEAVKFALSDYANRVAKTSPKTEHSRIESVRFEGGKLDGTQIDLSPSLNTLIGIRGSGKSSIIESLRYALGIELPDNSDSDGYKQGSVSNAIGSGGKVSIRAINRHGNMYEVRRILGERPDVYQNDKLQPGVNIRKTILHNPRYFGQKDLSSKGDGFEADLIERLVGDDLVEVRMSIEAQRQKVVETVRRLQKLATVEDREKEYRTRLLDDEHQLKLFKEHNVEARLQKQVGFDQDARLIQTTIELVDRFLAATDDVIADYASEIDNLTPFESKENQEFFASFANTFDRFDSAYGKMMQSIAAAKQARDDLKVEAKAFGQKREALKDEFAKVSRALAADLKSAGQTTIDPSQFLKLRKSIENTKQILGALKKERQQRLEIEQQLDVELTRLNELWHQEFVEVKQRVDKINEAESSLQIALDFKGDKASFLEFTKGVFRGSGIQGATLRRVTNEFQDGMAIYRALDSAKDMVGGSGSKYEEYFLNNLTAFLTLQVPNLCTIKYHGKLLKRHSLGQRASALILFVLSQRDHDIVIIDQPEDDLDNQTIYEDVIKLVRKLKPTTQFIFATHNPNIPVLGDAEQVIACDYTEDTISTRIGSIDLPYQQQAIVSIMEGGREAFRRRKEIYQAWKHQNS